MTTALLATIAAFGVTAAPAVAADPTTETYFTLLEDASSMSSVPGYVGTDFQPAGVAVDASGNTYFENPWLGDQIFKRTPAGVTTLFAGTGTSGDVVPGPAVDTPLQGTGYLATDSQGNLYAVSDNGSTVVKITPAGVLSVVAGSGESNTPIEGPALESPIGGIGGIALDSADNLYIADGGSGVIEKVTPGGQLSIFAGRVGGYDLPTAGAATATDLGWPMGLAFDSSNNLYVGSYFGGSLLKITPAGALTIIAGGSGICDEPVAGPALDSPVCASYVAVATDGTVYFGSNDVIATLSGGTVSIIAGIGNEPSTIGGDRYTLAPGRPALLSGINMGGLALHAGKLHVADVAGLAVLQTGPVPTLSISNTPTNPSPSSSFTPVVSTDSDGDPSVASTGSPDVCTLDAGTGSVSFIGGGSCVLDLTVTAGTSLPAWNASVTIEVAWGNNAGITTTFAGQIADGMAQPDYPERVVSHTVAVGGPTGRKWVSSSTPSVCTVSGDLDVKFIAAGTCTLVPHVDAAGDHGAIVGTSKDVTVVQGAGTIEVTNQPTSSVAAGSTYTPTFKIYGDGTPVVTCPGGDCTVDANNVVTFLYDGALVRYTTTSTDSFSAPYYQQFNVNVFKAAPVWGSPSITDRGTAIPSSVEYNQVLQMQLWGDSNAVNANVTFTSSTPAVCSFNGANDNYVVANAFGTCTLVPHADEGDVTLAGDGPSFSFEIVRPQLPDVEIWSVGCSPSFTLLPTDSPAIRMHTGESCRLRQMWGAVPTGTAITSLTPSVCTATDVADINRATVTVAVVHAGTCTVNLSVPAGTDTYESGNGYAAYSKDYSFLAGTTPTTPSISNMPATPHIGESFTPSFSTNGDGTKTVTSSTTGVCTVNGSGVVSFIALGTCSLTAHVAIGTNYLAADGSLQSVTVVKLVATAPSISNLPSSPHVGDSFTPSVTTTGDGTKSVTSSTTGVCTVNGSGLVSFVGAGTCTLVAHVAEGSDHQAADGSAQSVTVAKAAASAPSISNLPGALSPVALGGSFTPSVSTNSDGVKSVTSSTTSVCTVNGSGVVSYIGAGTCTLVAHVAEGSTHGANDGSAQSFTVAKQAASSPSISNVPGSGAVGGSFTPVVSTTGDGVKSVTSSTTSVCTVNGSGVVSYIGAGTCTLVAHVAEGSTYLAADGSAQSFTVGLGTPSAPSISNVPGSGAVGGSFTAVVSTTGDGTKSVTSSTAAVCTVDGSGVVSFLKAGTCRLTARVALGTNYAAGVGSAQAITVLKTSTTPSVSNLPTSAKIGGSFTPSVSTTGDGVKSVSSSTTSVCTVNGAGLVSYLAAGTCTLTARVLVGATYGAADGSPQSFTIGKLSPTAPSIPNVPGSAVFGGSFTPTVSTTGDGVKSVTSSTTSVCTVNGAGLVSYLAAGTCTLVAHVAASSTYLAADGSAQSFTVAKASSTAPSISNVPSTGSVGGTFTPLVTTTGDGATTVSSSTPGRCSVSGSGVVTFVSPGACNLVARVAIGVNFLAATGLVQSITVLRTPTSPAIANLPASPKVGGSFTPAVSTNGDGVKSVTSSTLGVCSVNGSGVVSFLTAGTCTIVAHVTGGSNFEAADGSPQSLIVGPGAPSAPTISNIPGSPKVGDSFTPAVSTNGDGVTSVTSSTPGVCSVNEFGLVTFLRSGTCRLTARTAAGTNYLSSAGTVQSFTVAKSS